VIFANKIQKIGGVRKICPQKIVEICGQEINLFIWRFNGHWM